MNICRFFQRLNKNTQGVTSIEVAVPCIHTDIYLATNILKYLPFADLRSCAYLSKNNNNKLSTKALDIYIDRIKEKQDQVKEEQNNSNLNEFEARFRAFQAVSKLKNCFKAVIKKEIKKHKLSVDLDTISDGSFEKRAGYIWHISQELGYKEASFQDAIQFVSKAIHNLTFSTTNTLHLTNARFILSILFNQNQKESHPISALFYALDNDYKQLAVILIKSGINLNLHDKYGSTLLLKAISRGYSIGFLRLLINYGALINMKSVKKGYTPLIQAASKGKIGYLKFLIDSKADLNAQDNQGYTSLATAASYNHIKCVNLLIKSGADVNIGSRVPLAQAACKGNINLVKLLIKSGADVNIRDKYGRTPLALAALNGHKNCAELFIKAKADINKQDKNGRTPLALAALNGHEDCVELFIKAKADINKQDKDGYAPLADAASRGDIDLVKLLIKSGAKVNIGNKDGQTPVALAALNGHRDCVEVLIKSGADVHKRNKNGWTPVRTAFQSGHMSCVSILFESETNTNRQSKFNQLYQKKIKPICSSLLILGRNLISRIELIAHSIIKLFTRRK